MERTNRVKVVKVTWDTGCFGYTAPPSESVLADWLDVPQAKAIYRHCIREWMNNQNNVCDEEYFVLRMTDGGWEDLSAKWACREMDEFERWCDRKGISKYEIWARD